MILTLSNPSRRLGIAANRPLDVEDLSQAARLTALETPVEHGELAACCQVRAVLAHCIEVHMARTCSSRSPLPQLQGRVDTCSLTLGQGLEELWRAGAVQVGVCLR
jgi:hypothetical protein